MSQRSDQAQQDKKTYPRKIPVPPNPAIARPTIRASIVGAAPHSAEPASNNTMLAMKMGLKLKLAYKADLGQKHQYKKHRSPFSQLRFNLRRQNSAHRTQRKGSPNPSQLLNLTKLVNDSSLNVCSDGSIKSVD
jgi:hypothetical protein